MQRAPLRVGLDLVDDGWAAAQLWIWGRVPVFCGKGAKDGINHVLAGLGLPPLAEGAVDGHLCEGLLLRTENPALCRPLPAPPAGAPLVTILICTFNRVDLLPQALASVDTLSWPYELLVVDDGSSDGTPDLLRQHSNPKLRTIRLPNNKGKVAALNRGLEEARGEYILVFDDDDVLLPGCLHLLASALGRHPSLDLVWGDCVVSSHPELRPLLYRGGSRLSPAMTRLAVLIQIVMTTGSVLIRKSALDSVGPFQPGLHQGEDLDMFLRLLQQGEGRGIPLPTSLVRSHGGLRGPAEHAFRKSDFADVLDIGIDWIRPIFRKRYETRSPIEDRDEGFAWALGLHLRGLQVDALRELDRWDPPYSLRERWFRAKIDGADDAPSTEDSSSAAVIVVHDGEPGSLEACLEAHAALGDLWVDLEVAREPLDDIRLFWPGHYAVKVNSLRGWVQHSGPWHLRLSAAPTWAPPPLDPVDRPLLPNLPAVDALLVLGAALNWPDPAATRSRLGRPTHPLSLVAIQTRAAIREGRSEQSLGPLTAALEAHSDVLALWRLAADLFSSLGMDAEARACEAKIQ